MASRAAHSFQIDGRTVALSSPGKPMFPTGFTKGQAIDYCVRVSGYLLSH